MMNINCDRNNYIENMIVEYYLINSYIVPSKATSLVT